MQNIYRKLNEGEWKSRRALASLLLTLGLTSLALGFAFDLAHLRTSQQGGVLSMPPRGQLLPGTVRFVAIGDTGTGGVDQIAIARRMTIYHDERPYDTVLMLGDNIYEDGDAAALPRKFEQPYSELLGRDVRFHAVLGNHDVRKGRTTQLNYKLFNMGGRAFYSFIKGGDIVEFFALDSTAMDEAQVRWLDGALASSNARWKIAYFHHPIYSSGKRHGSDINLRARLEPVFVRHKVAAVLSGHDHVYERTKPQRGIQYFVSGAGGKLRRGNIDRNSPFFLVGNDEVNSFMYFEVTGETLNFRAVDAAGNILDSGIIKRE
ncbi:MAG: metallophosphoesterase [Pyrinomonadaceae bacterium]